MTTLVSQQRDPVQLRPTLRDTGRRDVPQHGLASPVSLPSSEMFRVSRLEADLRLMTRR